MAAGEAAAGPAPAAAAAAEQQQQQQYQQQQQRVRVPEATAEYLRPEYWEERFQTEEEFEASGAHFRSSPPPPSSPACSLFASAV